ncbi:MerR family transcriptional regulator [Gulosibacter macacae]|uniref:MerR family transcriptional regulator n=1 Tax=Gulosibacter macacae TaxID=2488791 RepID=A0A3P3VX66_9MICO|nr:MerR family transcriptional regulator [Gulosibacter macacae]RRJ86638.1 MerR family transcriptional regulator [Gulosibacter macacae]
MASQHRRELDEDAPVFPIAVAAELAEMHPQTLRQYDRLGLVVPERTAGRVRRYSLADVARLREIGELSNAGVGLEGIARVVELRREVRELRRRVRELETALADERLAHQGKPRVFAAGRGEVVAIRHGVRATRRNEVMLYRPALTQGDPDDSPTG